MRQIDGQMSLIDFMPDKTGYSIYEQYKSEGYTNAWEAMPDHECEVEVIDRNNNRFKARVVKSVGCMVFDTNNSGPKAKGGYDICYWREVKKCGSCAHMRRSVYGLLEYHGWACFGMPDSISRSSDPEQAACDQYLPKGDCKTCKYRCWLHWDGKAHQGCDYLGDGFCKYERRIIDG